MNIPTPEFLSSIELKYAARYPQSFKDWCVSFRASGNHGSAPGSNHGRFIDHVEEFKTVNVRVGEEQWGDYETALASKRFPKDPGRLWGAILPFYYDDQDVFGFATEGTEGDQVYVWSEHTVVHIYASYAEFLANKLGR